VSFNQVLDQGGLALSEDVTVTIEIEAQRLRARRRTLPKRGDERRKPQHPPVAGQLVLDLVIKRGPNILGSLAPFALIGVLVVSLVNLVFRGSALDWFIPVIVALLRAALAAYGARECAANAERHPSRDAEERRRRREQVRGHVRAVPCRQDAKLRRETPRCRMAVDGDRGRQARALRLKEWR
jgi:hypothetical protein